MPPPLDPNAQAPGPAHDRLPTEESRLVVAWIAFGLLVVCVLSASTAIAALFH